MRRGGAVLAAACTLAAGFSLRPATAAVSLGRWVPGDLHVRTTYSGDTCRVTTSGSKCDDDGNGVDAPPTSLGASAMDRVKDAEQRGLSFIAITDLDTPTGPTSPSAQSDPEIAAYRSCHIATPATCPVLVLDGIEKSLTMTDNTAGGHLLAVGYSGPFPADPTSSAGWSVSDLTNTTNGALKKIHDAGGVALAEGPGSTPWRYALTGTSAVPVDGYDVWRGSYADQTEFTGAGAADNPQADARWQTAVTNLATAGKRLTAFGGSGTSSLATGGIEGPGQPSVWVYDTADAIAAPVTWTGIRQAILAGRVMVSALQPSIQGPTVWLEALDTAGAPAFIAGDSVPNVPAGNVKVHVVYAGAPAGATIRIIGVTAPGQPILPAGSTITVTTPNGMGPQLKFNFPSGAWYRAEMYFEDDATSPQAPAPGRDSLQCPGGTCFRDRYTMLALSGTLYGQ